MYLVYRSLHWETTKRVHAHPKGSTPTPKRTFSRPLSFHVFLQVFENLGACGVYRVAQVGEKRGLRRRYSDRNPITPKK